MRGKVRGLLTPRRRAASEGAADAGACRWPPAPTQHPPLALAFSSDSARRRVSDVTGRALTGSGLPLAAGSEVTVSLARLAHGADP